MSSDDFYDIFKYWPASSLSSLRVSPCPLPGNAGPSQDLQGRIQSSSPSPGTVAASRDQDLDCQPSERLILLLITIYGNRIRAELELNIDGSDWVGCVGQTENNKLCRKFVKSQNISIFTLCFCF